VGVRRDGKLLVNDAYARSSTRGRRYSVSERTLASFVRHKPTGSLFAIHAPSPVARATATKKPRLQ
jgi:hypothetical protein